MSISPSEWLALIAPGLRLAPEDVQAVRDAGVPMFAIANVALDHTPDAIAMYASDGQWWDHYMQDERLQTFAGRKFTQEAVTVGAYGVEHGIEYVEWIHNFDGMPPKGKTTGSSSGQHGLIVAHNEYQSKNIILLGFEYGALGDGHYFGSHPAKVQSATHWPTLIQDMNKTAARLAVAGVKVYNCTAPVSALPCFEVAPLDKTLELVTSGARTTRRTKAGS